MSTMLPLLEVPQPQLGLSNSGILFSIRSIVISGRTAAVTNACFHFPFSSLTVVKLSDFSWVLHVVTWLLVEFGVSNLPSLMGFPIFKVSLCVGLVLFIGLC